MTEEAKITVAAAKRSPNDFLKQVLGRPVVVKLNSGVEYRGMWLVYSLSVMSHISGRYIGLSGWVHEHCNGANRGV